MQILCTDPPYSFFALSKKYQDPKPLKRILSLMRERHCRTLVIDTCDPGCDIPTLRKLYGSTYKCSGERWYFFSDQFGKLKKLKSHVGSFLGSATIVCEENGKAKRYYVSEAVIGLDSNPNDSFFVHSKRTFEFVLRGETLKVCGSFFSQQHGQTDCCAHAAFRVATQNLQAPTQIDIPLFNQICGIDHVTKNAKSVAFNDLLKVIDASGLKRFAYTYVTPAEKRIPYDHMAYYALESGYPVLIVFNTALVSGHVVAAIGHTFNKSTWLPEAERDYFQVGDIGYIRSMGWVNNFVVQDDNYGPYYCIPTKSIEKEIIAIVAITDMNHDCYGAQAELMSVEWIRQIIEQSKDDIGREPFWTQVLMDHWLAKRAVVRTLYIKKDRYKQSLMNHYPTQWIEALTQSLPENFWLTELSVPELFQISKGKIADIIVDPYTVQLAAVRLPGIGFDFKTRQAFKTDFDGHTPLCRC